MFRNVAKCPLIKKSSKPDNFVRAYQQLFFGSFSISPRFQLSTRSTLHGYLSKILARSCQDLGKILAKMVTRYCQELQDAMVRSYQESHVSKKNPTKKPNTEKNLTKKPNMARKKLLRTARYREKVESENH